MIKFSKQIKFELRDADNAYAETKELYMRDPGYKDFRQIATLEKHKSNGYWYGWLGESGMNNNTGDFSKDPVKLAKSLAQVYLS